MKFQPTNAFVLNTVMVFMLALGMAFLIDLWGKPRELPEVPLVDPEFTSPATLRISAEDIFLADGDMADFQCNACHDLNDPPQLRFDEEHNIILGEMHDYIVLAHGRHKRNNNCFNCHDENNLEMLQLRDGQDVPIYQSADLCGSCHGPTYRDWVAGVHGRTSGFWNTSLGERRRKTCVACHDPHNPSMPQWTPAPGPHPRWGLEEEFTAKD